MAIQVDYLDLMKQETICGGVCGMTDGNSNTSTATGQVNITH